LKKRETKNLGNFFIAVLFSPPDLVPLLANPSLVPFQFIDHPDLS
jgi:hypothetical protein